VYLDISGVLPQVPVTATLSGPSVDPPTTKTGTSTSDGAIRLNWIIRLFGTYTVTGTAGQQPFTTQVNVH